MYTYIHNWSLQPLSQDYDLASHITFIECVNFLHEWRDLQFKVDYERQIFEKLFMAICNYSQSFCQKSVEFSASFLKSHFFFWQFFSSSDFLPEICLEERAEEIFSYFRVDV